MQFHRSLILFPSFALMLLFHALQMNMSFHAIVSTDVPPTLNKLLHQRWKTNIGRTFSSAPLFLNGRIYITNGNLICLDSSDGHIIWEVADNDNSFGRYWLRALDSLVLVSEGSGITAHSAATGVEKWHYDYNPFYPVMPFTADSLGIFIGINDSTLVKLDPETGLETWRFSAHEKIIPKVSVYENCILVAGTKNLFALKPIDGKICWTMSIPGEAYSSPVVMGKSAFLVVKGGTLCALDLHHRVVQWKVFGKGPGLIEPHVVGNTVVIIGDQVYAFNTKNGRQLWSSSLIAINDQGHLLKHWVLVEQGGLKEGGTATAISTIDGKESFRYWDGELNDQTLDYSEEQPDGFVYASNNNGFVYAFHIQDIAKKH